METKYKFECYWSQEDGWHFSFGTKRLWQSNNRFMVADLIDDEYKNHKKFITLKQALDYMRTN